MKKLLVASVLALSALTCKADDWSKADTVRQTVVLTTLAVDMMQTLDIKNHPGLHETNPILGRHPSDHKVVTYFLVSAAAHTVLVQKLPAGWPRQSAQYGLIALELVVIAKNKKLGINIKF